MTITEEEHRKIKDRLDEIEKSIADQAIKALHTHPEISESLSDITTRLAYLETAFSVLKRLFSADGTQVRKRLDELERIRDFTYAQGLEEKIQRYEDRIKDIEYRLREWNNRQKI